MKKEEAPLKVREVEMLYFGAKGIQMELSFFNW